MTIVSKLPHYSAFQIDELHHQNQNLVGTLHKGVPTVVDLHENFCNATLPRVPLIEVGLLLDQNGCIAFIFSKCNIFLFPRIV